MRVRDCVYFIVDPAFGERALDLPADAPVWIVNSRDNAAAFSRARSLDRNWTLLDASEVSAGDRFLNHLDSVDQHHNEFSSKNPYTRLHVIGSRIPQGRERFLREFGFVEFENTDDGFVCIKRAGPGGESTPALP